MCDAFQVLDRKLRYLLFGGHGEALQPTRHVTQALLKGRHKVSLQTHSLLKFPYGQLEKSGISN